MKLKQRPEDFSVKESLPLRRGAARRAPRLPDGQAEAVDVRRGRPHPRAVRLKRAAVSYCGLKDKQGRTEQLIAVEGADVDLQDPDLRLKFLGRTDEPLSAANITSNRFSVTVRALSEEDVARLPASPPPRSTGSGVVNYFDSQRFGSLKHGQGFIAKDLIRGDFEAALRNYIATPVASSTAPTTPR